MRTLRAAGQSLGAALGPNGERLEKAKARSGAVQSRLACRRSLCGRKQGGGVQPTDSASAKALYVYRLLVHDKVIAPMPEDQVSEKSIRIGSRPGMRTRCRKAIRCWNSAADLLAELFAETS